MNDQLIERLLQKAPRPPAPPGLLGKLQADIALPRRNDGARPNPGEPAPWFRRWFPALSFAAACLACVVVLAVQTNEIAALKRDNAALRASTRELEPLRIQNAEYQKLLVARQELEQLRKDFAELKQLRAEVHQLRIAESEADRLRAENLQLAAAARSAGATKPADDFFGRAEDPSEKALSIQCINNLKQIGLAARIYANDNGDVFPPNFLVMSNELSTPKILVCPADKGRKVASSWQELSPANYTYEFLNPNGSETNPLVLLSRCPVHGHICLSDGSVQNGSGMGRTFTLTNQDGRLVMTPLNSPAFQ